MVQRGRYRELDSDISVVTERMGDGLWAVAVSVVHATHGGAQAIPLPMTHERFPSEAEARAHGLRTAREWIEQNAPSVTRP
jgi:DNA-binding IclR family transcriptional regulator